MSIVLIQFLRTLREKDLSYKRDVFCNKAHLASNFDSKRKISISRSKIHGYGKHTIIFILQSSLMNQFQIFDFPVHGSKYFGGGLDRERK